MARDLGRDPATISREISRHCGQRGYRHPQADGKATARRQEASAVPRKMTPERWAVVEDRLPEGWRPEGRGTGAGDVGASSRTGAAAVLPDAAAFPIGSTLRSGLRWWPRRAGSSIGSGNRSLAQDPGAPWCRRWIGARSFPSWSGWRARPRRRGTAALTRRLGPVRDRVHTGTADHGKEFARHREIAPKLDAGFYFATPYHSWERGRNEHPNGLVREYFPKGTDFRQVTPAPVRAVEDRLHRRPRKVLGYRTPAEVFARGLVPP